MSEQAEATNVEKAAREMGWRPLEEFRGDASKWVDAETFVSRGEHFLPIIKADRDRLREQNAQIVASLEETKQLLTASQEAIAELRKYHDEDTKRAVEKARKDLVAQLKQAREDGDVDLELALQGQITKIDVAKSAAPPPPPPPPPASTASKIDPEFAAWEAENPWFKTDRKKHALAMAIAQELRDDPANAGLVGRKFYDKVTEGVEAYLGPAGSPPASKVAGGRPTGSAGSGASTRARTFADLPEEAKAACASFAKKLVGPGRAYKDLDAWQSEYAKRYFDGETA